MINKLSTNSNQEIHSGNINETIFRSSSAINMHSSNDDFSTLKDVFDSSAIRAVLSKQIKSGDSISISVGDKKVVSIKNEGVTTMQRIREFGAMAMEDASQVIRQDPAFAFKTSVLLAKEQVISGLPTNIATLADSGILPMIRIVSLVLDGKRMMETVKSERANHPDKIIAYAHVGTDIAGLAGAVMSMIPGLPSAAATAGTYLTASGIIGDIGAFGYNIMRYFENKGVPIPDSGTTTPPPSTPSSDGR